MTNSIGTGTANISINVPRDERLILGQAAFRAGAKSVGDFVRTLMIKGLTVTDCEAAADVRRVRRQYYGAICGLICLLTFTGGLLVGSRQEARRARRGNEERVEEVREAV